MPVIVEQVDGGVTVTLADGDGGNLLSIDEVSRLTDTVREADADGSSWVLLRHRGNDFCLGRAPGKLGTAEREVLIGLVQAIQAVNVLVISAADGGCAGFGAGLMALADISLVTEQAWMQFPEILRGSAPAIVATWLFDAVPHKLALYWIATAKRVDAEALVKHGIATRMVSDLDEAVAGELAKLRELDPQALRRCKGIARVMRNAPADATARRDIALRWFD